MNLNVSEPVQLIVFLSSNALIQFSDGVQGLTLPGGSPQLSTAYRSGAAASGNVFSGVVPLANGRFTLLDATSGAASSHAQVIDFNGTTFTVRSSSGLPSVTSTGSRADVWLFQQEPFVHRSPGFVSSLGAPDWTDSVNGLPGATDVSSETDGGVTSGLGDPSASNLGAAPSAATFGLGNQYGSAISVFAYSPPRAAEPVLVTISPLRRFLQRSPPDPILHVTSEHRCQVSRQPSRFLARLFRAVRHYQQLLHRLLRDEHFRRSRQPAIRRL